MKQQFLSNQELRRYKSQIEMEAVGLEGQKKLKNASVLVVGAGGIGNAALQYLAAAGIGEIGICDNTIISESDFQNQVLYRSNDLGKHKAIIASSNLGEFNDFNTYRIFNIFITNENVTNICKGFDLIMDTANDYQVSLLLDEASLNLKIPFIHASKLADKCRIGIFIHKKGSQFREFMKDLPEVKSNVKEKISFGSFGAASGIAGSILTIEALKILTNSAESRSDQYLVFDPLKLNFEYHKL